MAELKDRYAAALFDVSIESDMLEEHIKQAVYVRDALKIDDCEKVLIHPNISNENKYELLNALFKDKISSDTMGFLYLLIDKKREALMISSLTSYIEMGNNHLGRVVAKVVSATQLSKEKNSAIHELLSRKLNKQVEIITEVDPSLIGGFYIHIGGRLIDCSVRTQLYNMKISLLKGGIK